MHNRSGAGKTPFSKRRGHLQVMFEVLEVCNQPQIRTRIMQRANLSYGQMCAVLDVLEKYNLLKVEGDGRKKYVTSAKGREYAQKYNELKAMASLPDCDSERDEK